MKAGAVIRAGIALVLAASAHVLLLHAIRPPSPPILIAGGAVSFEIGSAASRGGAEAANEPSETQSEHGGAEEEADFEEQVPSEIEARPEPQQPAAEPVASEPELEPRPVQATSVPAVEPTAEQQPEAQARPASETDAEDPRANEAKPDDAASETVDADASRTGAGGDLDAEAENEAAGGRPTEQEGQSNQAGNAASDNYAGEVMRHLSQVRRPRASGPGSAFVRFTIAPSGELESIEISESSGSSRFDRDALRVVERAAPFPEPPIGVNRSFVVEIEGR